MANIFNINSNTLLSGSAGNDTIQNGTYWGDDVFPSNVTINTGVGNDSVENYGDTVTINTGSDNDSVWNYEGSSVTINTGAGDDYVYNDASSDSVHNYGSSITIDTDSGNDTIHNYGNHITISGGSGNDSVYNFGSSVTIDTGDGNDSINNNGSQVSINGGAGNDSIYNNCYRQYDGSLYYFNDSTGYGKNFLFKYASGDGNDVIYGFKADSTLSISGGSYSTTKSGDNIIVTVGTGKISLMGAASLSSVNIIGEESSDETNTWKLSGTTATYGTSSNTLITISGVKSLDGISLSGKVVTVAASALNKSKVTISDGYTLKLADDVSTTATTSNAWSYKNSVATLSQTKGAYYSLASDGKSISYSAGTSKMLATVKGVKSADGLSLKKKVITVAQTALNKSKITLSGSGYKLKLGSDVSTTATTSNSWSYKNSVATLKQTKGEKYSLASNGKSISYTAGTSKTLATVSGVKSTDGLSVKNKVVTVAASALNKSKITLSGSGYKLKLASDVSTTATTSNSWSYKNSVATLNQTKGAYYSLASDGKSISYSAGTSSTLATIKGAKSTSGLKLSGKKITLKNSALSKKVSVSGSYEFDFASDYKKAAITGSSKADTITSRGNNISITGGKGNDSINISGANNVVVYKSGDGSDTITNYAEDDTIKIASGAAQISTSGSDIVFTVGKGSILLKDAADKTVSYVSNGIATTFSASSSAQPYTINGAAVILSSSYAEESFDVTNDVDGGNKIKTIDASAVSSKLRIKGNSLANSIKGGKGNDTLRGEGNDDTLTGGLGSDVFIYYDGDGDDVITDYEAKDTIRIYGSVSVSTLRSDVVLSVGAGKITVQDVFEKEIGVTYVEDGVEHDYINGEQTVVMNEKKTNATITKNYWKTGFDFADFGKSISTVDATQVIHNLKITGNDKANMILGGSGKNTLIGGGGNDTLQGGDKADIFVYSAGDGNDIIYNVGANDTISIVSGTVDFDSVKGDTVIFTVGNGKISVEGAAGKKITYCDENGKTSKLYSNPTANVVDNLFVADDDNFATDNDLSALVQNEAADYSVVNVESALRSANTLETLTCSGKT